MTVENHCFPFVSFMVIDEKFLDSLSEQARSNPRLRQSFDLRTTPNDGSQRMLNALEPGTVMPIHRHRNSSETVVLLEALSESCFMMTTAVSRRTSLWKMEGRTRFCRLIKADGTRLSVLNRVQ